VEGIAMASNSAACRRSAFSSHARLRQQGAPGGRRQPAAGSARLLAAVGLLFLSLAAAGCGGSSDVAPPAGTGSIEGYVYARTRAAAPEAAAGRQATPPPGTVAVNGATVTLTPSGRQAITGVDRSGRGGFFRFIGLEPGSYTATVRRNGYRDATFTVQVRAGDTTQAGVSGGQTILEPVGTAPKRKWTVMVYLDADGDLEEVGILNMNQMESVGSDANINIVVQFDRGPGFDATNGDWTDTRRYLVTKDDDLQRISSPVLENLGEIDMGQPETLRSFIEWAVANYPAEHYVMVPWNHGAGWRSRSAPAQSRGIIFDDTSSTYLTMAEFNTGLNVPNVRFDLIAIDCSLMGMLEVAYEIKDRCDYITFSEESPPGPGYPYDTILGPNMTGEQLGRIFVEEHLRYYSKDAVTQSLIRTANLASFATKVDNFAGALLAALPSQRTEFDLARARSQAYAYSYYRDLYDFAANAKLSITNAAVASAADAILQGWTADKGGPVVIEGHNLSAVANSHGLSIYLPSQSQYFSAYESLAFVRNHPKWGQLVKAITTP
jgi:hypothetical protein